MATKAELEEKIGKLKKSIASKFTSEEMKDKQKGMLGKAQKELEELNGDKPAAAASGNAKELEEKIAKLEKSIASKFTNAEMKGKQEVMLKAAQEQLRKLGGAKAPAEKTEKKAEKEPVAAGKASAKKSPAKKAVAKKSAKKEKEEKEEKPKGVVNKTARTVTIDGVEYSVDKCTEAVEAWEAKIESNRVSGRRFAKKSSGEVIGDKLASVGSKVLASIKTADIDKKPQFYKDKLARLSVLMTELSKLIDELTKDKDASSEVKEFIKKVKGFMTDKLGKK
jgi:hypothetical protein